MLKMVRDLGLLAVGVAAFGLLIAWLLQGGSAIGNWLLALFLFAHGWIHAMYVKQPQVATQTATAAGGAAGGSAEWTFPSLDRSWLLTPLHTPASLMLLLGKMLVLVTIVGYSLAALASIPLLLSGGLWAPLVLAATLASVVLILLFFQRNLVIGLAVDAVLLWVVVAAVWVPGA